MKKQTKNIQDVAQRVIAFLNRKQVDFLDKLGKDALFSTGVKLSRVKIISCLVDVLMELRISGEEIASLEELKQKIKEKLAITGSLLSSPSTKGILLSENKQHKVYQNEKK